MNFSFESFSEWLKVEDGVPLHAQDENREKCLFSFLDKLILISGKSNLKFFIEYCQRKELSLIKKKILLKYFHEETYKGDSQLEKNFDKNVFLDLKFKINDCSGIQHTRDYNFDYRFIETRLMPFLFFHSSKSIMNSDFNLQLDKNQRSELFQRFPISLSFTLETIRDKSYLVLNLSYLDFDLEKADLMQIYQNDVNSMFNKIKIQLDKIGGFISTRLDSVDRENFSKKIKLLNISIYLPEIQSPKENLLAVKQQTSLFEAYLIKVLKIFLNIFRYLVKLKH